MRSPSLTRFLIAGAFLGSLAGGAYYARTRWLPSADFMPGVRVDGEPIPAGADVRAFVEVRAQALRARRVQLVSEATDKERPDGAPAHTLSTATLGELGVEVDVERVVDAVHALGQGADLATSYELREQARRGEIDVPLLPTVNADVALPLLESFKEAEDLAPVSARLDLDHHGVMREKDGRYLDVDATIAAIAHAARAQGYANDPATTTIPVPMTSWKPRVSSAFLDKIDITQVVSTYETTFSRGQSNRSRNVEVAAARVNGVVLSPGASMSFNEIVGARSEENGFQKAGEIFKGEMIEGVGGGTCQVASTLHAIAFFGGLDILERLPHSRPSAYIPLGLDATVVYPSVDLKLRNPYDFPVVVHAYIDGSKVKMELLGARKPVLVTFGVSYLGSSPFTRKIVEQAWVTKPTLKQHGIKGVQIRRTRALTFLASGERRVETSFDTYPPTQEIYNVPPGFDQETLPALGEDESAAAKPADPTLPKKPLDSREGADTAVRHG